LKRKNEQHQKEIEAQVIALNKQGISIRKIATALNLSPSKVNRITKMNLTGLRVSNALLNPPRKTKTPSGL